MRSNSPAQSGAKKRVRTPENEALIVEAIRRGAVVRTAAERCGLSPNTVSNWLETSPEFRARVEAARQQFLTTVADMLGDMPGISRKAILEIIGSGSGSRLSLQSSLAVARLMKHASRGTFPRERKGEDD